MFGILLLLLGTFVSALPTPKPNPGELDSIDQVKALCIVRLCDFSEWPPGIFRENSNDPFVIGVMKNTQFLPYLVEIAKSAKIQHKKVKILVVENYSQIKDCHMLYIPKYSRRRFKKVMSYVKNLPILTVGDTENYENRGVMINLFPSGGNIRFNVNYHAAQQSGITITSHILKQARKVIKN